MAEDRNVGFVEFRQATDLLAVASEKLKLLQAERDKFKNLLTATQEAIRYKKVDLSALQGFDEDDLEPTVDILECDDRDLSKNDLVKKQNILKERLQSINVGITQQQKEIVVLTKTIEDSFSQMPLDVQFILKFLHQIGQQVKIVGYIDKYLALNESNSDYKQEHKNLLASMVADVETVLQEAAEIALQRESTELQVTTDVRNKMVADPAAALTGEQDKTVKQHVASQIKFQNLPSETKRKLIEQRVYVLKLNAYLAISDVRKANPALYAELSGYYKQLQANISNALLNTRDIQKADEIFANIKSEVIARESELVTYIYNQKLYNMTNAKVMMVASVPAVYVAQWLVSWIVGGSVAVALVSSVPGASVMLGAAIVAQGLRTKADRETQEQLAGIKDDNQNIVARARNNPTDSAYMFELDKKFGIGDIGVTQPIENIKIEVQTVENQIFGVVHEVYKVLPGNIKAKFNKLSMQLKILSIISMSVLLLSSVTAVAAIPIIGPWLLLAVIGLAVGAVVAVKFGPMIKSAFISAARGVGNLFARINIDNISEVTFEPKVLRQQIVKLNDFSPGLADKLSHHFVHRNMELQDRLKSLEQTFNFNRSDINALRLDIDKLHKDWDTIVANINNPEKLCDFMEDYLKKQYVIERGIFTAGTDATAQASKQATIYKERLRREMYAYKASEIKELNIHDNSAFNMSEQKNYAAIRSKMNELSELKDMVDNFYNRFKAGGQFYTSRNR